MSDRPLKEPSIPTEERPVTEPVRTPEFTNAAEKALQEGFGAIDLQKLQQLIDEGVIPETVMGLYQEMHDPSAGTPLLDVYRTSSPEKQQKILRALERTAQKMESAAEASPDKLTIHRLIHLLSLLYLALLYRNTTQLTGDKTLDPGKNNEGAVLRILELGGAEVFSHPEQFEITNLLQFCTDLIDQGHGAEVLHHIEGIPVAYHSHIVLRCLQSSRQKAGTGDTLYIIEALSHTKELDLDVAQQLCRLKLDTSVIDHLEQFQAAKLEEIIKLLLKNERVAFAEVFKRLLDLSQKALGEHVIVAACVAKSGYVTRLLEDSDQDLQEALQQRLPDLKEQLEYIRQVNTGHKTVTYQLKYVPTAKLADKIGKSFHGDHPLSLPNVRFLRDDVARSLVKYTYEYVELRGLTEITDVLAEILSNPEVNQLNLDGVERMSPRAQQLFSERRGWFIGKNGLLVQSDKAAMELVKRDEELHLEELELLSYASADLLCNRRSKKRVYLDGIKQLEYSAMKALRVDGWFPISLNGYVLAEGAVPDRSLAEIIVKNYKSFPSRLSPTCLRIIRMHQGLKLSSHEGITLPEVSSLSPEEAAEVALFSGQVLLDGLVDLTVETATALSTHRNGLIRLGGLTELRHDAAVALGPLPDGLSLPLIKECSLETLEVLCRMQGPLTLNGFTTLTLVEALMLATHRHSLTLNRVSTFTEGALNALLEHEGPLSLLGLTVPCSPALEKILYQKRGWLPGSSTRSDGAAEGNSISADLSEVTELSTPFAKLLIKNRHGGVIGLDSVRTMSDEQLEVLATFASGDLSLKGLVRLSANGARALSEFRASIYFDPDIQMDEEARLLMAPYFARFHKWFGGKGLPAVAVQTLVELREVYGERIHIDDRETLRHYSSFAGLESISVATAELLAKTKTPIILGVTSMTEEVAKCFEGYTGVLCLPKLKHTNVEVLGSLGAMTGLLILPSITHLTEQQARALATHKGRLALTGIAVQDLSRDAWRVISVYPGKILLKDIGKGGSFDKEVQEYLR